MSIRLTRFPRTYVDNSLYLHGRKSDLDVDGEKRGREKRVVDAEESRTCRP